MWHSILLEDSTDSTVQYSTCEVHPAAEWVQLWQAVFIECQSRAKFPETKEISSSSVCRVTNLPQS